MTMFLLIAAGTLPWIFLIDAVWGDDDSNDDHHEENTDPTDPIYPTDETDPTDVTDETDPTDVTDETDPTDVTDETDPTNVTDETDPTDTTSPTDATASLAADVLWGGPGNDTIDGLQGDDTILGWAGDDRLFGNEGADVIYGGAGNDLIVPDHNYYVSPGDDDFVNAGDGDDTIWGDSVTNDTLLGGAGNDSISGQGTLHGNQGDDTLRGAHDSHLYGDDGDDILMMGVGDRNFSAYDNVLTPTAGRMDGGSGNDTLVSGDHNTLTGGEGEDTFELWSRSSAIYNPDLISDELPPTIMDLTAQDHVSFLLDGGYRPEDIRFEPAANGNVRVYGDFHNDDDTTTSVLLAYLRTPGEGYEAAFADALEGRNFTLDDVTSTGEGTASIAGGIGHDTISVFGISDEDLDYLDYEWDSSDDLSDGPAILDIRVEGGGGDDSITVGLGADTALGGEGNDTIDGFDALYHWDDPVLIDAIYRADLINGGAGDDSLIGGDLGAVGQAGDTLIGGAGDDTLLGQNQGMTITMTGGAGADHFVAAGSVEGPWGALFAEVYTPDGDPIEITDFRIGEDVLEVTGVAGIRSVSLTQTADGDTVVRVDYDYDIVTRSGEISTETVTGYNAANLFVLRGVTGATVEDLFGGNPAG